MIATDQTLAKLATEMPSATRVFMRHGLDFCCGGNRSIDDACISAGLDPQKVAAEIEAESEPHEDVKRRWDLRPLSELVDHILSRYHEPLHRDLPAIVEAARKVERVHAAKASCPHGLTELLEQVHAAVEDHLAKEEQVLFPLLRRPDARAPHMPIRIMMQEHEDHGANLARIRELTSDFTLPPEACTTWRFLYHELEVLEADLMEHIHLENNVLFVRALNR